MRYVYPRVGECLTQRHVCTVFGEFAFLLSLYDELSYVISLPFLKHSALSINRDQLVFKYSQQTPPWWRHGIETLSTLLAIYEGNPWGSSAPPSQRATNLELWCFLWCNPEQTIEQTVELSVAWDAITIDHCNPVAEPWWRDMGCLFVSVRIHDRTKVLYLSLSPWV